MGKTYFLPPDFLSFPAAQGEVPGAIQLGQLVSSINDPGHAIATLPPLSMTTYNMVTGSVKASGLGHHDSASSSFFGELFLKAVSLVGARLKVNVQRSEGLLAAIDEIEALSIDPKDTYVKASLEQTEVQKWLKAEWPQRRVFMVSGLLIAKPSRGESSISISSSRVAETEERMESDVPSPQAPVQGSAALGSSFQRESGLNFVPRTPFIYAFRLRQCFLKKELGSSKPFTKGAKMSVGGDGDSQGDQSEEGEDFIVRCSGIAKRDVTLESLKEAGESLKEEILKDDEGDTVSLVFKES
ncbi:hypothetical protein S7711_07136 [Stachybotrys chartarum IBT 7711]|uniref:Uncharacterized protein n=1 Tax=Stachybotrys chartarum (strain CBS 109288 / IBT 7711) TaxID=1280523 RepID=A0A084BCE2_STACB|nr:hypothetical protein S7711_07136 [Stachybotrys chartarum IBT 7711]